MGLNVKLCIVPDLEISIFEFSSLPVGTSEWGIFGIDDKIVSNSFLTLVCNLLILSISDEIF